MAKKCFLLALCLLFCAAFAQEPKPLEEVLKLRGLTLFEAAMETTGHGRATLPKADWFRLLERLYTESE